MLHLKSKSGVEEEGDNEVVLAPVLSGALLNQYCNSYVEIISPLMSFVAVAMVAILWLQCHCAECCSHTVVWVTVISAVCCLHVCGLFVYIMARIPVLCTAIVEK